MAKLSQSRELVPYDEFQRGERLYLIGNILMGTVSTIAIGTSFYIGDSVGHLAPWFTAGIAFVAAWIAASIRTVRVEELAGIEFFGAPVKEAHDGGHFVPFGIFTIRKLPGTIMQDEFPAEPEKVFKGSDAEYDHNSGLFRPIRITAGVKAEDGDAGTLESQMTAEVQLFVQWRIKRGSYFRFRKNIFHIDEARKQLRDAAEGVLVEIAGVHTIGWIVRNTNQINAELLSHLRELAESWGVEIIKASIKEPDLTHEVNEALRDVPVAKARAQETINKAIGEGEAVKIAAEATKRRLVLEGEGEAKAIFLKLQARGKGIGKLAKEAGVCGSDALAADTLGYVLDGSEKYFFGGADGMSDLLKTYAAAKSAFPESAPAPKGKDTPDEEVKGKA